MTDPIVIEGIILWEDPDDPQVVIEIPNPGGPVIHDMVLTQALSQIWREQNGPCQVRVSIEVTE